jgi:L-lysine 2,3-aminomutase
MVIHTNHAREIDGHVELALEKLAQSGVSLLNQSVLLRRVHDDLPTLIDLSRRLVSCGVLPYYLHQLDAVQGAAHFEVAISRGLELIAAMRAQLPGYAVPRYVQEIPGQLSKTVLA